MGNRNLTNGERTGLIVLAIVLTAIVAFTSIDFGREEPRPAPAPQPDTTATVTTVTADTAAAQPAKRRQPGKKPRKPRPEPPRRNPRSERVDNGFADNPNLL